MDRRNGERREPTFGRSPPPFQAEDGEVLEPTQSSTDHDVHLRRGPATSAASFDWLWFLLLRMPGRILTWLSFMWPTKGDIWANRRRYGNASVEVTYSIIFWIVLGLIVISSLRSDH